MKQKYINIIIIICSYLFFQLFLYKDLIYNSINFSLTLWIKNLVPTLFPIFVLSDILISYNIVQYIPFKRIFSKLFNISEKSTVVFFLSLISGFPSNAINVRKLYDNKEISSKEAEHILSFTHFSNPLFILNTLSLFFFNNQRICIIIFFSHYLSNIILGIILRSKNYYTHINDITTNNKSQRFGQVFTHSIKKSIDNLLSILGITTCFLVLSEIIIIKFNFNPILSTIIKGILEITIGIKSLSLLNINELFLTILSSIFLSFGGFSVHMQVLSQLEGTDISYKKFFLGRIYQTIISGILAFIIYKL